jgi:hypothetical protein
VSDLEKLLDGYKDDGVEDSTGAFTIDFQKAREKLSKFQLADPHELILKLVQAGNLASSGMAVSCSGKLTVSYEGWNKELTLQKLADRLASASLIVGDDPLTHLCVGLSAMMAFDTGGIRLRQTFQGETAFKVLTVGKSLHWEELESGAASASDQLVVSMRMPAQLSTAHLKALLEERCGYAPVLITWEGKSLVPKLPQPTGAHRPKFFDHNKVLAEHCLGQQQWNTPLLQVKGPIKPSERMAHLTLTVDLDPRATSGSAKPES